MTVNINGTYKKKKECQYECKKISTSDFFFFRQSYPKQQHRTNKQTTASEIREEMKTEQKLVYKTSRNIKMKTTVHIQCLIDIEKCTSTGRGSVCRF